MYILLPREISKTIKVNGSRFVKKLIFVIKKIDLQSFDAQISYIHALLF